MDLRGVCDWLAISKAKKGTLCCETSGSMSCVGIVSRCMESLGMWEDVLSIVDDETGNDEGRLFVQDDNWDGSQYLRYRFVVLVWLFWLFSALFCVALCAVGKHSHHPLLSLSHAQELRSIGS